MGGRARRRGKITTKARSRRRGASRPLFPSRAGKVLSSLPRCPNLRVQLWSVVGATAALEDAHHPDLPQLTTSASPPAGCQQLTASTWPARRPTMQEVNNSLPYDAEALPDIAATLKSGDEEPKKAQEPLPEVPKGPLTVSQAYAFLGVAEADRGQLDKVKQRGQSAPLAGNQLAPTSTGRAW